MNEHDSFRMMKILAAQGYDSTDDIREADVVIVNTCSVRANPQNKVFSFLGTLAPLKKKKPSLVVGVAGCVAQQEGENILKKARVVDMVFGPDNYFRLPEMLAAVAAGERVVMTEWCQPPREKVWNFIPDEWLERGHVEGCKAYIAISKGCSNMCSFCIVPSTRGREICRPAETILQEAGDLIAKGAREIWLLGQNVNSYCAGDWDFYRLLEAVAQLPLARVRFTSPHPKDWDNRLSDLMAARPALCSQLHMPLQSGSDRILKAMNRRHTLEEYLDKVRYMQRINPGIEISTDIIVGFPSETEADFEGTLRVMEEVRFGQVFSFKYSPRPGTRAARLEDDVPREVKEERLARLIACQDAINAGRMAAYVGTTQRVLLDGVHPRQEGVWSGRTDGYRPVSLAANGASWRIGDMLDVVITGVKGHWLLGNAASGAVAAP